MNIIKLMCATAILATTVGGPALAQDAMKNDGMMSSGSHMKMSMADKKMMTRCQGMTRAMMMKSKGCMKMMKMHPGMMKAR